MKEVFIVKLGLLDTGKNINRIIYLAKKDTYGQPEEENIYYGTHAILFAYNFKTYAESVSAATEYIPFDSQVSYFQVEKIFVKS